MSKRKYLIFLIPILLSVIIFSFTFSKYKAEGSTKLYPVPSEFDIEFNNKIDVAFLNSNNNLDKEENKNNSIVYIQKNNSIYDLKLIYNNIEYVFDADFKLDNSSKVVSYSYNNFYAFLAQDSLGDSKIFYIEITDDLISQLDQESKINSSFIKVIESNGNFDINTINKFFFDLNSNEIKDFYYIDGNNYIYKYDLIQNDGTVKKSKTQHKNVIDFNKHENNIILFRSNTIELLNEENIFNVSTSENITVDLNQEYFSYSLVNNHIVISFKLSDNKYSVKSYLLSDFENGKNSRDLNNYFEINIFDDPIYLKPGFKAVYSLNKEKNITSKYVLSDKNFKYVDYYSTYEIKNDYEHYVSKLYSPKAIKTIQNGNKSEVYILDNNKVILKYVLNENNEIINQTEKNVLFNFTDKINQEVKDFKVFKHNNSENVSFVLLVKDGESNYLLFNNSKISEENEKILKIISVDNILYTFSKIEDKIYMKKYIITNDKIKNLKGNKVLINEFNQDDFKAYIPNKTSLYIVVENTLYSYILNSYSEEEFNISIRKSVSSDNLLNIDSLFVSKIGNVYILKNNEVYKFDNKIITGQNLDPINLNVLNGTNKDLIKNKKLNNFDILSNRLFLLDEGDKLFILTDTLIEDQIDNLELTELAKPEIYKIKENAYLMLNTFDFTNIFNIVYNDNTPLFYCISETSNYYFGYTNLGQFGFIDKNFLDKSVNYIANKDSKSSEFINNIATTSISTDKRKIAIYSKPFIPSNFQLSLMRNTEMYNKQFNDNGYYKKYLEDSVKEVLIDPYTLINVKPVSLIDNKDSFAVFDQKWYYIEFIDSTGKQISGYTLEYNLSKKTDKAKISGNDEHKYLISLSQIGSEAKIYSEPNSESKVLFNLKDGQYVYSKNGINKNVEFTKIFIKKDGKIYEGYINTKYLQNANQVVTKIQATAIIILIIFIATTIVIFMFIKLKSKIYDEE